ncbi:MAG: putative lipoprotein [Arenicella sp.]|jgi:uncharacterized lipoprotein
MTKLIMTSIKQNIKFSHSISVLLVLLMVLSVSACGGVKKVITADDSAEYKSARALPPLKKPSRIIAVEEKLVVQKSLPVEENVVALDIEPNETVVPVEQSTAVGISAMVVTTNTDQSRLEIMASFDQAWDYLSEGLKKSDLTVFSRNKEAGRFSIGCAAITAAPAVVKSGRWSFFNRDKTQNLEYCGLEAIEKRGTTVVSVLNRNGIEVSGEYSNKIFKRLLNN